jgi:hypothetical protein
MCKWDTLNAESDEEVDGSEDESISLDKNQQMYFWHKGWLKECYRILKPGGVIKAFSATRTYHRLGKAMEDVGFKGLKMEAWVYGCLSDDSELQTRDGWITYPGDDEIVGKEIRCYSTDSQLMEWLPVERGYSYDYNDTAYHIVGEGTDHIVSKNHWVVIWNDEDKDFVRVPAEFLSGTTVKIPTHAGDAIYLQKCTVTPIENYRGRVWCVQVPTGIFLARRNGMEFITGNSGFPKSMNIAKAIDKKAGIKIDPTVPYEPTTELAKKWNGYGTALKPAWEVILVGKK